MNIAINDGVELNVIPEDKFKTISFTVDLIAENEKENLAKRAVLAELMEISNEDYSTQSKLARKLSSMYGATFGTNVLRYGNLSVLRISLSIPNPKFFDSSENILNEAIEFLKGVLFHPLVSDGSYDEKTFELQRKNMKKYVSSIADNKRFFASTKLKELFFKNDINRGIFLYGREDDYDDISAKEEYDYYQEVMANDNVKISVIGDVNESNMLDLFKSFEFGQKSSIRRIISLSDFAVNKEVEVVKKQINSSQSYLNMGYRLPVFYDDDEFMAAVLFNAVFGGTPQSKLFKNVREKNSLAYSASSSYSSINGFLMVSTGINARNYQKVIDIVEEQLNEMINGNIDLDTLNSIKAEMINAKKSVLDSPRQSIEQEFTNTLLNRKVSFAEWEQSVLSVSVSDIARVARKLKLNSIFFLEGRIKSGD
ncbi:MAG: insulinase family protein [Apilactobacillus sp.]|uniref:EF-P 5-aminopentanol modification-associated protein YfmF n=1 Tax=Apilactobacillus sp. TaxID=2767901 RepID=UPI0025F7E71B|nr:insulinase family protein [Apilactobacillus sp.]MCT6822771.1 insulinase family protein [Apilactobacillus sp.]